MSDERKVTVETTIHAEASEVWRAITEGEELKRWFPLDARVKPGPGGSVWQSFGEGMDWESPIEIWEPERHLRTADPAPSKMAVDYFIESKGGETVFRIVHSGFGADAWDDELDNLNAGWRTFALNLRHYLERHPGKPRTMAYFRHPVVPLERKDAFSRLLDALGIALVGEGQRYDGTLFRGVSLVSAPPVNFSGTIENHDDGLLMLEVEPGRGQCRPAAWVSLYGEAGKDATALQDELRERLTRAFSA